MRIIVDAHQDLAWNHAVFGRDYTRSVQATRQAEENSLAAALSGHTLLGLPEYLQGGVAVIFGALFVPPARLLTGRIDVPAYADSQQAYDLYAAQLDYYRELVSQDPHFRLIGTRSDLQGVLASWNGAAPAERRVGLVPLMEGADGIRQPDEVAWWKERGLRAVGLAWAGTRYAGGTGEPGPLTDDGRRLLQELSAHRLILDLSHTSDEAFLDALDRFDGAVMASHSNPRALLKETPRYERALSDEMIRRLAGRGGVMGIVPYNRFLRAGWQAVDGKEALTLEDVATAIDHVCQLTGSAAHAGIGSDFDGGFGVESVPAEIDTIADLQKLGALLEARGYSETDVRGVMGMNWVRLLRRALPG